MSNGLGKLAGVVAATALCSSCASIPMPPTLVVKTDVDTAAIERHVRELASDQYQGRGAGTQGGRMAARYIAEAFSSAGLKPLDPAGSGVTAYFQKFSIDALGAKEPWVEVPVQNVVGLIRGGDLASELVVIGGHFDGQGQEGDIDLGRDLGVEPRIVGDADTIWNSAIDNATSIAALIEIARSIVESGHTPRRSIAFVAYDAEESGLEGSVYFVANPIDALGRTVVSINLEQLVGDSDDLPLFYAGYGTAPVLVETLVETIREQPINQLRPFIPGVLSNTDYYAFALNRQPALTFGTPGGDSVHTPYDEADNLDYALLGVRANFIRNYLMKLADSDGDFTFTGDLTGLLGAAGGRASEIQMASRGKKGVPGYVVTMIVSQSPAAKAGLKPRDIVIAHNGTPIDDQKFYQGLEDALGDMPSYPAKLTVLRDAGVVEIEIVAEVPVSPER